MFMCNGRSTCYVKPLKTQMNEIRTALLSLVYCRFLCADFYGNIFHCKSFILVKAIYCTISWNLNESQNTLKI